MIITAWMLLILHGATAALHQVPNIQRIDVKQKSVVGGTRASVDIYLTDKAPKEGWTIVIGTNTVDVQVPPQQKCRGGSNKVSCTLNTSPVLADEVVTIIVNAGSSSAEGTITVMAPRLRGLDLTTGTVAGGSAVARAKVTLKSPAPSVGMVVALESTSSAWVGPRSITVPPGKTSLEFGFSTTAVSQDTNAKVTARLFDSSVTKNLTIKGAIIAAVSIGNPRVTKGDTVQVMLSLTGLAPIGGLAIAVSSSNNAALPVPKTFAIPAGAMSASLPLTAGSVSKETSVTITFALNGKKCTQTVTVLPSS